MDQFVLKAPYSASGDQPQAIEALAAGIQAGMKEQILLGVTGSGKTFTMASVIEKVQDHFDESIGETILRLADERQLPSVVPYLLAVLITDQIEREGLNEPVPSEQAMKWLIDSTNLGKVTGALLASYGISMPEDDEDSPKNPMRSRND